MLLAKKNKTFN